MTRLKFLILILALSMLILPFGKVKGTPSSDFTNKNGEWYDSFGIDRNVYDGPNGYLPNMAYETLGSNKELAFSIGESFKENYASTSSRAEAILNYVQTWTEYGYDSDNVVKGGVAQDEWAWNADEMAHKFDETAGVKATGDCEDMAFLCATIYAGAGIEAAVVDAPEHVACLIWLPDYANADHYWDIGDGKGNGWIWVEATGSTNPLGWTPPDFADGNWNAYPISSTQQINVGSTPVQTKPQPQPEPFPTDLVVMVVIAAIILLVLFLVAGSRKKKTGSYPTNYPQYQEYPPPPPPPP
jgi:hypothetical protein